MIVKTEYMNGAIDIYDTESKYCSPSLFKSSEVCAVSYRLDMTNIANGIFMQYWVHDFSQPVDIYETDPVSAAQRTAPPAKMARVHYFLEDQILDPQMINDASRVLIDGEPVLWRLDPDMHMVVWTRFMHQVKYYLTNNKDTSYFDMAAQLFELLYGDDNHQGRYISSLDDIDYSSLTEEKVNNIRKQRIADLIGWNVNDLLAVYDDFVEARKVARGDDPSDSGRTPLSSPTDDDFDEDLDEI